MKKNILLSIFLAFAMFCGAQVSVWDGTAEPWTNGSGTAEDPYLIENAQHLAYLAQQVNAPNTNSQYIYEIYAEVFFLLTNDIDLGRNAGLVWTPIGKNDAIHNVQSAFAGHFDGGMHTIHNMHVEYSGDESNLDFGLFGMVKNGSIKNIIMASDCDVDIKYGVLSGQVGMSIGGIIGMGYNVDLENCVNRANISADVEYTYLSLSCGGLFGNLYIGSSVKNCHNYGNVYCRGAVYFGSLSPAGIVSRAEGCDIVGCSNSGNITSIISDYGIFERGAATGGIVGVARGECNIEKCSNTGTLLTRDTFGQYDQASACGGILGSSFTLQYSTNIIIKNCYSVADISTITDYADKKYNYAGGIFGATFGYWNEPVQHNITIENCYAAGTIVADTIGGIIAHEGCIVYPRSVIVSNSYYSNTIESWNEYGESLSDDYMRSAEFVNVLNTDDIVFTLDVCNVNNGFPVFINSSTLIGSEWYYEIINNNTGDISYQYLACVGDTVINHKNVKIIVKTNTLYDKKIEKSREYIYEYNGCVYWWHDPLQDSTMLYNFAAEVGDEWQIKVGENNITMHVDDAGIVEYNGQVFRSLTVSDANDVFSGTVVCGIGHLTSFFPEQLLENKGEFDVDGIRCYWNDDILLYKEDDTDCDAVYNQWHSVDETIAGNGFEIYPNPSYNVLFVLSENINSEYRITNILGETIASGKIASENQQINVSSLPEGMYFITIGNATMKFMKK